MQLSALALLLLTFLYSFYLYPGEYVGVLISVNALDQQRLLEWA